MTVTIHQTGPDPTDWALVVRDDGVVAARKSVPFDGVLTFSTEDRHTPQGRNSQYRLSLATVVDCYIARTGVAVSRRELITEAVDARRGVAA